MAVFLRLLITRQSLAQLRILRCKIRYATAQLLIAEQYGPYDLFNVSYCLFHAAKICGKNDMEKHI